MKVQIRTVRGNIGRATHPVRMRCGPVFRASSFGLVAVLAALALAGCGGGTTASSAVGSPPTSNTANPTPTPARSTIQVHVPLPNTTPGTFSPTGSMATARAQQTASLLSTGRVLIAGGGATVEGARAELYDPTPGTFSPTGSMHTGRYGATATVLSNGRVLIAGGWSEDPDAPVLASAELYDPASGTFLEAGPMTTPRAGHTATLLSNGRVLITGGQTEGNNVFSALATAELYDPATGTFSPTGSMTVARVNHTATLLPGGRVLIAGGGGPMGVSVGSGVGSAPSLASAELYDPANATFGAIGSMAGARFWHTATLLLNGRVLIAGGGDGTRPLASTELYDPATESFSKTGSMSAARYLQTATTLANGFVLVAGGYADNVGSLESAELYDPNAGLFSPTGSMSDSRFEHTATLLTDGLVLIVAGGSTDESIDDAARLAKAELYQP